MESSIENTRSQWRNLAMIALAELLAMTLWFSASAVVPTLKADWGLSSASVAWLTMSVQIGFVIGALFSGFFNLPDLMNARHLFAISALLGAASNAVFALFADGLALGIPLRVATGVFLAGVYPPGMKLASSWTRIHRGLAIGLLVGALTIGSASPHLVRSLTTFPWTQVILASSVLAIVGGLIVLLLFQEGPFVTRGARFEPRFIARVLAERGALLTNLGYLGHMWELYAMWTWIPVFLVNSLTDRGEAAALGSMLAFSVIAIGGAGCVAAGVLADRYGRTAITSGAMIASGSSAILAAFLLNAPLIVLMPVLLVWGVTIVADSAQFSAAITELSPPEYVGTALTLQTAAGFLLTLLPIQLVPFVVDGQGWTIAFLMLAIGPAVGTAAMLRLRVLPEAAALAGGRR